MLETGVRKEETCRGRGKRLGSGGKSTRRGETVVIRQEKLDTWLNVQKKGGWVSWG